MILTTRKVPKESIDPIPLDCSPALRSFLMHFSKELSNKLSHMHDVQCAINLVPSASLPNLSHYHRNPSEYAELKRQVEELIKRVVLTKYKALCDSLITYAHG